MQRAKGSKVPISEEDLVTPELQERALLIATRFYASNTDMEWQEIRSIALESLVVTARNYSKDSKFTLRQTINLAICRDLIDYGKKTLRRRAFYEDHPVDPTEASENETPAPAYSTTDVETEVYYQERINALPELEKQAVRLLLEGYTQKHVARQLGLTIDALRYRLGKIKTNTI